MLSLIDHDIECMKRIREQFNRVSEVKVSAANIITVELACSRYIASADVAAVTNIIVGWL